MYIPALDEGDNAAMSELLAVLGQPALGVLRHVDEKEVLRLGRAWDLATAPEEKSEIFDQICDRLGELVKTSSPKRPPPQ